MDHALNIACKTEALSQQEIYNWLMALRQNAYTPASGYNVSAIIKANYGGQCYYFGGVNCENAEQSLSTHGEDGAVAAMVTALGRCAVIENVWVMGATEKTSNTADTTSCCGRCRQRLAGFATDETAIHMVSLEGVITSAAMKDLLPRSFSFKDYLTDHDKKTSCGSRLTTLNEAEINNRLIRKAGHTDNDIFSWLSELEAIDYTSAISQSAIIVLDNGHSVAGVRIEDAAFTGINAVQSAIALACARFGTFKISRVFMLSKSADPHILPKNAIQPLSLSALQALYEFTESDQANITCFSASGQKYSLALKEAAQNIISFKQPYMKI